MNSSSQHCYRFSSFQLDPNEWVLLRDDKIVPLTPKAFETLRVLVERRGHVVSKDDLLQAVWPDTFVEEGALAKNISVLRKILAEDPNGCSIETIPKRGYRLVGEIRIVELRDSAARATEPDMVIGHRSSAISRQAAGGSRQAGLQGSRSAGQQVETAQDRGLSTADQRPRTTDQSKHSAFPIPQSAFETLRTPQSEIRNQKTGAWFRIGLPLLGLGLLLAGAWIWSRNGDTFPFSALKSKVLVLSQARGTPVNVRLSNVGTRSPEAYDLYLKGSYYWREKSHDGLFKSIAYFRRATEKDPNFALAYAGLAEAYAGDLENLDKVDPLAQKAISLDRKLAEPHRVLGFVRIFRDHNWKDAERELQRALQLNPADAKSHHYYASYLTIQGQLDQAEKEIQQARVLDPDSLSVRADHAQIFYFKRAYEWAIDECKKILVKDSRFFDAHMVLYHAYTLAGRYNEAFDEYLKIIELLDYHPRADLIELERLYKVDGVIAFWKEQIALYRYWGSAEEYKAYEIAEAYALLNFKEQTLTYLSKACDKPINYNLVFLKVSPIFDPVRDDPRFARLLVRLGLSE